MGGKLPFAAPKTNGRNAQDADAGLSVSGYRYQPRTALARHLCLRQLITLSSDDIYLQCRALPPASDARQIRSDACVSLLGIAIVAKTFNEVLDGIQEA